MATDLGKVGIRMRGNWSNSATYEVLDAVTYNNALYIAKYSVPAGTLPTNTTYWQIAVMESLNPVAINISESVTVSSGLQYTGVSITIPANKKMMFGVYGLPSTGEIQSIYLTYSSSVAPAAKNTVAGGSQAACSFCGGVTSATTFYVWASFSAAATHTILALGYIFD